MNLDNGKPNIILVDDHLIFRQGLKTILTVGGLANVIGEASNGVEFLNILTAQQPDLVFMDIDIPHINGIEATKIALSMFPQLKIVALTMFSDEEYYTKMIECGVKGFVLKTDGSDNIEECISEVIQGKSYFSREILKGLIVNSNRKSPLSVTNHLLSERELAILKKLCLGLTSDEIAEELNISAKTVKTHRANLLDKLKCKNTPAMMIYAIKKNIVDLDFLLNK